MMVGDRFDTDIRAGVLAVCREYQTLALPNHSPSPTKP